MNKNGLLLAGLAAFAYYKYNKMTPEAKKNMMDTLKSKVSEHVPENFRKLFGDVTGSGQTQQAPEYGKGTF